MPRFKSPHLGMQHLNGHLLAAVDVETTGLIAGYHDLIQVAILPLDSDIKPCKTANPFYMTLRPIRPENIDPCATKVTRLNMAKLMQNAMDPFDAADLFDEWFEGLNLPITTLSTKKIMPLWSNGGFDKAFLIDWLGPERYANYFHFFERDTQVLAMYINDRHYMFNERVPFGRVGLNNLASYLRIINDKPHDALQDAITTAEVYRRLVHLPVPIVPGVKHQYDAMELAIKFHETYERLAPEFGYETRAETRKFNPDSPNGKLMIAVCDEILNK